MHEFQRPNHLAVVIIALCALISSPADGAEVTFSDRIPDLSSPWPTWIEGKDGSVLMAYGQSTGLGGDGRVRIAESTDGGHTWTVITYLKYNTDYAYMSRMRDGRLIMVVYNTHFEGEDTNNIYRDLGWVASTDEGRTWSELNRITIDSPLLNAYGPIIEMPDGRWAYSPYTGKVGHPLKGPVLEIDPILVWSEDQGKTWSKPIHFSAGADGNRGLSEMTIAQLGPTEYVAAIRSDESPGGWDGFYLSRSTDGSNWSVPTSLGENGRMPMIYRIEPLWVLTYRQYVPADNTQYSAYRVSNDGITWSAPQRIERGVNNAPFLVRVGNELVAFNHGFPDRARITRNVVALPATP